MLEYAKTDVFGKYSYEFPMSFPMSFLWFPYDFPMLLKENYYDPQFLWLKNSQASRILWLNKWIACLKNTNHLAQEHESSSGRIWIIWLKNMYRRDRNIEDPQILCLKAIRIALLVKCPKNAEIILHMFAYFCLGYRET